MRLAALVSGGKDSLFSAAICEGHGWRVEELITLRPIEKDSLLFHTPNLELVALLAESWGKKYSEISVRGEGEGADLEALRDALAPFAGKGYQGVTVGAIGSSYQWSRVWRVAHSLGLEVFAPLWRANPAPLIREEILSGMDIRIAAVATEALGEDLLGKRLDANLLVQMDRWSRSVREFHVAGEGGDYETLVLDAPFLRKRIEVQESHVERAGSQATWVVDRARLAEKDL